MDYQGYSPQAWPFPTAMQYGQYPVYPQYTQYYRQYPPAPQPPQYPVRPDRVMPVNGQKAQSVYPPAACVFVGNISTDAPVARLGADLEAVFGAFGPCHAKVRQDRKKKLPTAFVQFHTVEPATMAQEAGVRGQIWMHGRQLRVEKAKGLRTLTIGHRTGADLPWQYLFNRLSAFGALENWGSSSVWNSMVASMTATFVATFAYVDDCKDAAKTFRGSPEFWAELGEPAEAPKGIGSPSKDAASGVKKRVLNEAEKRYFANGGSTLEQYRTRIAKAEQEEEGEGKNEEGEQEERTA